MLEAARGPAVAAAERQLVHVLGRPARRVGILLVVGPADVDHVGGKQQVLALVDQGQRVRRVGLRRARGAGRGGRRLALLARSCLGLGVARRPRGACRRRRSGRTSPQSGTGQEGPVEPRGGAKPVERRRVQTTTAQSSGSGCGRAQEALATLSTRRSSRRQPALRPQLQERARRGAVAPGAGPGTACEHADGAPGAPRAGGRGRARSGSAAGAGGSRMGEEGHEPDIEVAVEPGLGQAVEHAAAAGPARRCARPASSRSSLMPSRCAQAQAMAGAAGRCRRRARAPARRRCRETARRARRSAVLELDRGLGEARPARRLADQPVPEPAELLLVLEELEAKAAPLSRGSRGPARAGPALTSASSESGSISACLDRGRRRRCRRGSGSRRRPGAGSRPTPRGPCP